MAPFQLVVGMVSMFLLYLYLVLVGYGMPLVDRAAATMYVLFSNLRFHPNIHLPSMRKASMRGGLLLRVWRGVVFGLGSGVLSSVMCEAGLKAIWALAARLLLWLPLNLVLVGSMGCLMPSSLGPNPEHPSHPSVSISSLAVLLYLLSSSGVGPRLTCACTSPGRSRKKLCHWSVSLVMGMCMC
jgi:hypothetical protein